MRMQVSKNEKASTEWSEQRGGFLINLPKRQVTQPLEFLSLFKGQILSCFEQKDPTKTSLAHRSAAAGDDWADVEVDRATGGLAVVEKTTVVAGNDKIAYLPDFNGLGRPDDLLLKPPYHLMVYSRSPTEIEVQCGHSPTLQLLSDYLKKWCRTNHNLSNRASLNSSSRWVDPMLTYLPRQPPSVEIKLCQSAFGLGLMYDRLLLQVESRYCVFTITPAIILNLVEGVLGYERVYSDGNCWTYQKTTEWKTL